MPAELLLSDHIEKDQNHVVKIAKNIILAYNSRNYKQIGNLLMLR